MDDEMKEALKVYLKENLSVGIDVGYAYGYHGRRVEVFLMLDGERFSSWAEPLPDNDN